MTKRLLENGVLFVPDRIGNVEKGVRFLEQPRGGDDSENPVQVEYDDRRIGYDDRRIGEEEVEYGFVDEGDPFFEFTPPLHFPARCDERSRFDASLYLLED